MTPGVRDQPGDKARGTSGTSPETSTSPEIKTGKPANGEGDVERESVRITPTACAAWVSNGKPVSMYGEAKFTQF